MKKKEDVYIGGRIRSIRNGLGLDQKEFATLLKITVSALSNWENGRNKPKDDKLDKIANLGRTTKEELVYGDYETRIKEIMLKRDNAEEDYFNYVIQHFEKIDKKYPAEEEVLAVYDEIANAMDRIVKKKTAQDLLAFNIQYTLELLSSKEVDNQTIEIAINELKEASVNYETRFKKSVDVIYRELLDSSK